MKPPSESTKLETSEGLVEYVGSGKLKNKKVLITGGEWVHLANTLWEDMADRAIVRELVDQSPS